MMPDTSSPTITTADLVFPSDETVADVPASMGVHDERRPGGRGEEEEEEETRGKPAREPMLPLLSLMCWVLGFTAVFTLFVGALFHTSDPGEAGVRAVGVAYFAAFSLLIFLLAPGALTLARLKRFEMSTARVHDILLLDLLGLEEIGRLHAEQLAQMSEVQAAQTQALRETVLIMRRMETAAVMREAAQSKPPRRTGATSATKPKEDDHVLRGNTGHRLEAVTIDAAAPHRPTAPTAVVSVATIAVAATPAPRPTSSD